MLTITGVRFVFIALLTVCTVCLFNVPASSGTVPHVISYQGVLANPDGTPIADGSHHVTCSLYTDAAGTSRVWSTVMTVITSRGIFNVMLGDTDAPFGMSFNEPLWLGVQVENGVELRPLTRLAAAPYALEIPDSVVGTDKLQSQSVTQEKMGADYVAHVSVNGKTVSTKRGGDIDITVGTNLVLKSSTDSSGNVRVVIDGQLAGGLPAGAIVGFPTTAAQSGFTYTGLTAASGEQLMAIPPVPDQLWMRSSAVCNGQVYALGGADVTNGTAWVLKNSVQRYDSLYGVWTQQTGTVNARLNTGSAELNNKLYVVGGELANDSHGTTIVEEYDPLTGAGGTWAVKAPMAYARLNPCCAVLNGKMYVFGGSGSTGNLSAVEEYTPAAGGLGTWRSMTSMPLTSTASAATLNGKIYVVGGLGLLLWIAEFNPAGGGLGTWRQLAAPPSPSNYAIGLSASNGRLYLIGGSGIYEFDPTAGSRGMWTIRGALPSTDYTAWTAIGNGGQIVLSCTSSTFGQPLWLYTPPTLTYLFRKN